MDWLTKEMQALLTSGLFGAITRTVLRPHTHWKAWLAQMFIGLVAAVFLGQFMGHFFIKVMGTEASQAVYYAVGYIIGTSAERVIEALQNRFLNTIDDDDDEEKKDKP